MEIGFRDSKLQELCEKQAVAARKLGDPGGRKLRARLAELRAASSVTDLVAGRPHPLTGDRAGQFGVDLAGGLRLVFAVADDPVPVKHDGSIDWSLVTAVRIEFIVDYHD